MRKKMLLLAFAVTALAGAALSTPPAAAVGGVCGPICPRTSAASPRSRPASATTASGTS